MQAVILYKISSFLFSLQ